MRTGFSVLVGTFGVLASFAVSADHHGSHTQKAHVHGLAHLNVVFEENQLHLELITPAMNIVGFEHKPTNAEQEKLVKDALALLQDAEQMFDWSAEAGCESASADVETVMMDDEHHEHDDEGHDQHGEHGEHDKHEHDEHAKHSDHDEEVHSEFHATYVLQCKEPTSLEFLDVRLFQLFPGKEEIEVQLVGPKGQTALELDPENIRIAF
ncbi:MAG: DUF2796 domain-containing protein [Candidatus Competibacteraceae bacterium]|jgi:hypothetical protein|nr:DUF2796 domain-containing protein [Candidatus Competibacteraceae bacterium]